MTQARAGSIRPVPGFSHLGDDAPPPPQSQSEVPLRPVNSAQFSRSRVYVCSHVT